MSDQTSLRDGLRDRASAAATAPAVKAAVADLVERGGGEVEGVVFFGSRRTGAARADAWSAYDFFVIVRGYRSFFGAVRAAGLVHRSPWILSAASRVLPPSQVSLVLHAPAGSLHAKCSVIEMAAFQRETSERRADHFCIGRLFQPANVVFSKGAATEEALLAALLSAHTSTYRWVRPWLPATFDAAAYCRRLLEVSLSMEVRPEPTGRAQTLFAAQEAEMVPLYARFLRDLEGSGELRAAGADHFALARPVGRWERLRVRAYFARSLARATLRWAKHVVTFEGWLEYMLRKVHRHGGGVIELTERERRLPLVFLWPRIIRYLLHKDR